MLSRLAKSTTHFLVCKGIIEREDEEVYAYGTELLYSAVLNIFLAVIISLITDTLLPTFLFMLPFIIIRQCIGGYHAKTHIGCMAILGTVLIVFFQIVRYLPLKAEMPVAVTLTIVSVILTIAFAPVEHPNKPLSDKDKHRLRKRGAAAVVFAAILIIILSLSELTRRWGMYIALGMFTAAAAMFCQVIKYQRAKVNSDITGQNQT